MSAHDHARSALECLRAHHGWSLTARLTEQVERALVGAYEAGQRAAEERTAVPLLEVDGMPVQHLIDLAVAIEGAPTLEEE